MSILPFQLERLGLIMQGDAADPNEAWGVLNPAGARGRDGHYYIFPRVVAENNYSLIGIARVLFTAAGEPAGVKRLGYALEPSAAYELNHKTGGGCEDARVTYIKHLDIYVMVYTAYSEVGPRLAMAISRDLFTWERLGLVRFSPHRQGDLNKYANKDGLIFPEPIKDSSGRLAIGLIHRPMYSAYVKSGTHPALPSDITDPRDSMWISYCPLEHLHSDLTRLVCFEDHHVLAQPEYAWEQVKIGGGAPPLRTPLGWLVFYHGVTGKIIEGLDLQPSVRYAAGAMLLDLKDPRRILYRSEESILEPSADAERSGMVSNVVFPTAVDLRENGRIDVYYGMADARIGVARLTLPAELPAVRQPVLQLAA